ncbi:hypothetical protein CS0771_12710 [Catellatospora sp. IY07-71]|uniref:hypothetical protein n=1 Tax=Catellatospora sp. IY07-71 TaxID=2728827 RepID=UPI001BB33CE4|nr:hypothetical protein [Catellatospora sp. IY07-71]BCJ71727.1 hypothetical protein CS0771_12710 [Catellatospora sp. IY07-71]
MPDFDDDLISDAFAGFTAAAAPSVRATGTGAVRHTVKRRRARNTVALSVLGALLLAVPVAAYASMDRGSQGPPPVAASPEVTVSPSPSPSPSAVPTGPDGRFTLSQLTAAKVEVPAWTGGSGQSCASGRVRLPKIKDVQYFNVPGDVGLFSVVHTNLDDDAALETAALIACKTGEASRRRVLAFDRDENGRTVMTGIVASGSIWTIAANRQGGIDADVSDFQACCSTPKVMELHQIRTYGWNGTAFAQLSGPEEFAAHDGLIDLAVSVKGITWAETKQITVAGAKRPYRTATVVLKVVNKGPAASGEWMVLLDDSGQAEALSGIGQAQPVLDAGATVEVTVTFRVDETMFDVNDGARLWVYELGTVSSGYDRNKDDNRTVAAYPK